MAIPILTREEITRFFAKTKRSETADCLEWTGCRGVAGYGKCRARTRCEQAHRVAWAISKGPIPPGLFVLHHCDNRRCVNVNHLFLGTHTDNARDREAKGRGKHPAGDRNGARRHPERLARGERQGLARLTEEAVRKIREEASAGTTTMELAATFSVDRTQIRRIVRRQTWKHV